MKLLRLWFSLFLILLTRSIAAASNSTGPAEAAPAPKFSRFSGIYTNPFTLTLAVAAPASSIRYTLDGSEPGTNSLLYTAPVLIRQTTVLRARSFGAGLGQSAIVGACYTFIAPDLQGFSSNLPLMVVNRFRTNILLHVRHPVYVSIFSGTGRTSLLQPAQFHSRARIAYRGSSSLQFPKKSYALETLEEDGENLSAPLLGLPEESDWILYAPYSDKTMIRDVLTYELSNEIGRYATRTRFVELFLNSGTNALSMRSYQGVYVLIERIKRDKHRVNIQKLLPQDSTEPNISGGYILKRDRLGPGERGLSISSGQVLVFVDPKEPRITAPQKAWIRNYLNQFEQNLKSDSYRDPANGYARFIDPDSFIDHHILVELAKNIDGYRLSTFLYKDRGGKLTMGPLWDFDLTFGNANYLNGWIPTGWYYSLISGNDYAWYPRLFADPEFKLRYFDRWAELRKTTFTTSRLLRRIDELAAGLEEAQVRNYKRWPILGTYVWPNQYIGKTFQDEVNFMKRWTSNRLAWIDTTYLAPPSFNHDGGRVPNGFLLRLERTNGIIFYTVDGTDPRARGDAISATALQYKWPLALPRSTTVKTRALVNGAWSTLNSASFVVAWDFSFAEWQSLYFTSDELADPNISGPNADPDHDGYTNYQEYQAGTVPKDAASKLEFSSIRIASLTRRLTLGFSAQPGKAYRLEARTNMPNGSWSVVAQIPPADVAQVVEWTDPLPSKEVARYYRLVLVP